MNHSAPAKSRQPKSLTGYTAFWRRSTENTAHDARPAANFCTTLLMPSPLDELIQQIREAYELVLLEEPADAQAFGSVGQAGVHRR